MLVACVVSPLVTVIIKGCRMYREDSDESLSAPLQSTEGEDFSDV